MVCVLRCHHFSAQDVFTTDNEPLTIFTTPELGFVATDQCYIEVYKLQEQGCPRAYRFPTVAPVKSLVYSDADDFLATLEEKPSASDPQTTIRVYLNWRADLSKQPMRASIAGHMTSLRHNDADKSRFEVVEVPLKGTPSCLTVDPTFGVIAVGMEETLLVYGFCTKTVAETKEQYKDIKCLLELEFSFPIHQVALVNDYLAVCSEREVQVVQLKMPLRASRDESESTVSSDSKSRVNPKPSAQSNSRSSSLGTVNDVLAFENRNTCTPSPSQCSVSSTGVGLNEDASNNYIVQDEHFVQWTFDDTEGDILRAKGPKSSKMASVAAASAKAVKTIVLKGLATVQGKKQTATHHQGSWELLGPVDNPVDCPVTVEFEDICNPNLEKRGHVVHGVRTCLYRKFEDSAPCLHSLQLIPVYLQASHINNCKESKYRCGLCPALNCDSLVGMSVFVSSPESGYLYNIQDTAKLLATYPYTMPALRVSVGDNLVYAVTAAGLEVYTSCCRACALHRISPMDDTTNTLPPDDLTPCLVGLQPFIGAQEVSSAFGHVVLLTKDITSSNDALAESSWSLYVLRCQPAVQLYHDMMELAEQDEQMLSPPMMLHLLQEAHLLVRTHRFLHGAQDDEVHSLICESAAQLGDMYASMGNEGDWHLALPYYIISGLEVGSVVRRVQAGGEVALPGGQGLLRYLDYMIFTQDHPISCSQEDGDRVLSVYAALCPSRLSSVLLRPVLLNYSPEKALEYLTTWMEQANKDQDSTRLDVLASAVLHIKVGQPDEAELKLFSIPQNEIFKTCVTNPWILHEELAQFSPLAQGTYTGGSSNGVLLCQMLCRHHRSLFIKILVALLEQDVLQVDRTMAILQGKSDQPLYENRFIMEYLEQILTNESREQFFQDTARCLVEVYIALLRQWAPPTSTPAAVVTVRDIIPKGHGHFAKRFSWLDYLPPFKGPKSLLRPCVRLQAVRCGSSNRENCACCHCNAELLKLQSLLCSSHISPTTLNYVTAEVESSPGLRGHGSLRVLCAARLNPSQAVDIMFTDYPSGLLQYTKDMLGADTQLWSHLVQCIVNKLNMADDAVEGSSDKTTNELQDTRKMVDGGAVGDKKTDRPYLQTKNTNKEPDFSSILAHMAEVLTQKDVLSLIPPDGSTSLFLPAVIRTQERHCAQQLKERIVSQAQQLQQRPA